MITYLDTRDKINRDYIKLFSKTFTLINRLCDEKDLGSKFYDYFKEIMAGFLIDRSVPACMKMFESRKDFILEY